MEYTSKCLGYWISAKKSKKLSVADIEDALRDRNITPRRIDLNQPIKDQGPFDGFLYKLTDFIAKADSGDPEAAVLLSNLEEFLKENPHTVVIDPIDSIRTLINRYKTYVLIQDCDFNTKETVFVPPFVILESIDCDISILRRANVQFPVVCKPIVAHGSPSAHKMTLVFNERGLSQCQFPCIVQSFINHNAVLYKLFVIGEECFMVKRPSIKNLFPSTKDEPIDFRSDEISKPESSSQLTLPSPDEREITQKPCIEVMNSIAKAVHKKLKVALFGVDVVLETSTGRYAIVDVNVFPGYDGVPDFPEQIAKYIRAEFDKLDHQTNGEDSKLENKKSEMISY